MLPFFWIQVLALITFNNSEHAMYISVLEIDQQEIRVKVFTDNLEDAIRNDAQHYAPPVEGAFHVVNQQYIEAYFQKKIVLKSGEKRISLTLKKSSHEGDSYWFTFTPTSIEKSEEIELKANYLMELFPDQTNVVKVMSSSPKFFRLTKFFPSCSFKL